MRIAHLLLALAATLLLSACASGGASLTKSGHSARSDLAYIARVEQVARRRGVQVHWVNPPREREQHVASY